MSAYKKYLSSPPWKEIRESVMTREKGVCELCGASATQVHHVKYPKRYPEDHPDNCMALCNACHEKQHGIRVEKMHKGEKVVFEFSGKRKSYAIDCYMNDGFPWVPIEKMEASLYDEESANDYRGVEEMTRTGRFFKLQAATQISPHYRRVDESGNTWVRASGVLQLLMLSKSEAARNFREQLGDWLEGMIREGKSALSTTQGNAMEVRGQGFALLRKLHQESGVMLDALERHETAIAEVRGEASEAKEIAKATQALIEDYADAGYELTEDFLMKNAPELATREGSKNFGAYLAKTAKSGGGNKCDNGWYSGKGKQLSKTAYWHGGMRKTINKWYVEYMAWALPRFLETL